MVSGLLMMASSEVSVKGSCGGQAQCFSSGGNEPHEVATAIGGVAEEDGSLGLSNGALSNKGEFYRPI